MAKNEQSKIIDIEKQLNDLLEKFNMIPNRKKYDDKKKAINIIKGIMENLKEKVAIVAVERSDINEFCSAVPKKKNIREVMIQFENDYDIFNQEKFDTIIYVSYIKRNQMLKRLNHFTCEYIDLYDLFENNGLVYESEFYKLGDFLHDGYAEIFYNKEKYRAYFDIDSKEKYLEKLIFSYLDIRDFDNAIKYINIYISENYSKKSQYENFKQKLVLLFVEIENILNKRKQKDIIMNWVDAIQYDEIKKMEFLNSKRYSSLFFENAYTVSPWTLPTYFSIFCQKKMVDDHYFEYRYDLISKKNSELLRILDESGYFFSRKGTSLNIFQNERFNYAVEKNEENDIFKKISFLEKAQVREFDCKEDLCPMLQWKALKERINCQKPMFILIHTVLETHTPYISANIEGEYINNEFHPNINQIDESRQYVDEQLRFYERFEQGKNITRIYMSDHGKNHVDLNHTMLIIESDRIKAQHCDEMFSLIDFVKLVKFIIQPDVLSLNGLFREYVEIQDLDKYKQSRINSEQSIIPRAKRDLIGYRAIRKKDELFVRRNDGKEYYYRLPCLLNQIENKLYNLQIQKMRSQTGTYSVDIFKYDYFKFSRISYLAIQHYNERTKDIIEKAKRKVCEIIQRIPEDAVVALRGGGEHSVEILKLFGGNISVKYIIDNNINELKKLEGYNYINVQNALNIKIDVILISSYKYHVYMRDEMKEHTRAEIIDIYQEFEKQNIETEGAFYGDDIIKKEDFEAAFRQLRGMK